MAYQQRYTPVAGLSSSSNEMRENRYSEYGGVTTQGTTSDTETGEYELSI